MPCSCMIFLLVFFFDESTNLSPLTSTLTSLFYSGWYLHVRHILHLLRPHDIPQPPSPLQSHRLRHRQKPLQTETHHNDFVHIRPVYRWLDVLYGLDQRHGVFEMSDSGGYSDRWREV